MKLWNLRHAERAIVALWWAITRVIQELPEEARKAVVAQMTSDLKAGVARSHIDNDTGHPIDDRAFRDRMRGLRIVLEGIRELSSKE